MLTTIQQTHEVLCSLVTQYFGIEVSSEHPDQEIHNASYRFPDMVENLAANIRIVLRNVSIHHPGIYRFGKPEMTLTKKIILDTRNDQGQQKLFDFLLALKLAWTTPALEIRLTVTQDYDRKVVVNMEAVTADNKAVHFHMTS
jgi:hypothetical protein